MSNTYVCVHVLQDVPPANLNRDDNGSPKTATYGGVDRLRVSSQAWKRATRKHFGTRVPSQALGVRTRRLQGMLVELMIERGLDEAPARVAAEAALTAIGIKASKKEKTKKGEAPTDPESEYLLFAGRQQLAELADAIVGNDGDVKGVEVAGLLGSVHPLDVALFGRMVADMTQLNVDAAAQVAHAISTHPAPTQFDYFTAVDDDPNSEHAGAGMIGIVEFNSGTLYRYAAVGVEQLVDNMGDREAAVAGIGQFIESFVSSMPTGKQNTFAAHTRPALVLIEVRSDQPVSLVSAFERPVRAQGGGFMEPSLLALAAHSQGEAQRWGDEPLLRVASYANSAVTDSALAAAFGESRSLPQIVAAVTDALALVGAGHE